MMMRRRGEIGDALESWSCRETLAPVQVHHPLIGKTKRSLLSIEEKVFLCLLLIAGLMAGFYVGFFCVFSFVRLF